MINSKKTRKGAASFYIVAFSTLILMIIATSFATVIISEISRSSNDDLSQSAYDAALAGIEDAKVAFSNYRRCVEAGAAAATSRPTGSYTGSCAEIRYWMEHPDCYMVGHILGKIPNSAEGEVMVGEQSVGGAGGTVTTNQAYTCVKLDLDLTDYRATLSSEKMSQVVRLGVNNGGTNSVNKIRIGWYSVRNDNAAGLSYKNYNSGVKFGSLASSNGASVPPTLEVQLVQTSTSFNMSDFDKTTGNATDRATMYLVPSSSPVSNTTDKYIGAYNSGRNVVTAAQVVKTNDRSILNKPFAVYCPTGTSEEFYCITEIELPDAIGGARSNDTFMLGLSLPYQRPDTDFSVTLICNGGNTCGGISGGSIGGDTAVQIKNSQISIDSTGRANDLYRRVETRLETSDTPFGFSSPYYALQILGNGTTEKKMTVTSEYDFYF